MLRWAVVLCVLLCATSARWTKKKMQSVPLQEQVLSISPSGTGDGDEGFDSPENVNLPQPKVKMSLVPFDEETMPHPDENVHMLDGPDRVFIPKIPKNDEVESGPVHLTRRNMVVPGTKTITVNPDKSSVDIKQAPSFEQMQSTIDALESLNNSEMPSSNLQGDDCTDESSVMGVGETPTFSDSPMLPTREAEGAIPEVNSYRDFTSGLPVVVPTTPNAAIVQTPPKPEIPEPEPEISVIEGAKEMGYKFTGKLSVKCSEPLLPDFDERFGRTFQEALSLAARVPVGNVAISGMAANGTLTFDVGAPSFEDVRVEISLIKEALRSGNFATVLKLKGVEGCKVDALAMGDGKEDQGFMPEPTLQDQLGPPGGKDDEALSPAEQRERMRVREAMTYKDYVHPGRYNLTRMNPDTFRVANAGSQFHVLGRLKFLVAADIVPQFDLLHKPLVLRGLASATGLPATALSVRSTSHVPTDQSLVQVQAGAKAGLGELPYVLVDFEIPASSLQAARSLMTAILTSLSDPSAGLRTFLESTGSFPKNTEFSLMFIEIHGPNGEVMKQSDVEPEEEESCDDADDKDEAEIEPSPEPVSIQQMQSPTNCTEVPKALEPAIDPSVKDVQPEPSHESWPVMTKEPMYKTHMNLPGLYGRRTSSLPESAAVQIAAKTKHQHTHAHAHAHARDMDSQLGLSMLLSAPPQQPASTASAGTDAMIQSEAAVMQTVIEAEGADAVSKEMPEAEQTADTPPGGFPVSDKDSGAV